METASASTLAVAGHGQGKEASGQSVLHLKWLDVDAAAGAGVLDIDFGVGVQSR